MTYEYYMPEEWSRMEQSQWLLERHDDIIGVIFEGDYIFVYTYDIQHRQ